MALTQCEQYEPFWRKHRDDWRPCTPADVWGLREDREFQPPSRGHLKRLLRPRPTVTPAAPARNEPDPVRLDLNARIKRSREVLAACGCLPRPHAVIPREEALAVIRRR